jgi:hypothetical protein
VRPLFQAAFAELRRLQRAQSTTTTTRIPANEFSGSRVVTNTTYAFEDLSQILEGLEALEQSIMADGRVTGRELYDLRRAMRTVSERLGTHEDDGVTGRPSTALVTARGALTTFMERTYPLTPAYYDTVTLPEIRAVEAREAEREAARRARAEREERRQRLERHIDDFEEYSCAMAAYRRCMADQRSEFESLQSLEDDLTEEQALSLEELNRLMADYAALDAPETPRAPAADEPATDSAAPAAE